MKLENFRTLASEHGADNTMQTFPVATFVSPTGVAVTVELPAALETVPDLEVVNALFTAAQLTGKLKR